MFGCLHTTCLRCPKFVQDRREAPLYGGNFDALGGKATNDRIYLFGSNFGDTASLLKIVIWTNKVKRSKHALSRNITEIGFEKIIMAIGYDLRHPWSNPIYHICHVYHRSPQ